MRIVFMRIAIVVSILAFMSIGTPVFADEYDDRVQLEKAARLLIEIDNLKMDQARRKDLYKQGESDRLAAEGDAMIRKEKREKEKQEELRSRLIPWVPNYVLYSIVIVGILFTLAWKKIARDVKKEMLRLEIEHKKLIAEAGKPFGI